ncbi:MAG: TolC family protein, partial [Rugosibacter sp.]
MRTKTLAFAIALAFASPPGWTQMSAPVTATATSPAELTALTLDNALSLAESANPTLNHRRAELAAAEGAQDDASAWLNSNPEITLDKTRREVALPTGSDRYREWNGGIAQKLEIAGQRGHRQDAADASMAALRAEIAATRQQIRGEVEVSFYRVLALQQRAEIESRALKLFDDTATAIQKRRVAGEDTRLDANVASVEAERARNQLAIAQEQLLEARSELGVRLQMPPARLPQAMGDLVAMRTSYVLADLLARAESQPRLLALAERENSADARLNLERASRYPDITVGANVGREGPVG